MNRISKLTAKNSKFDFIYKMVETTQEEEMSYGDYLIQSARYGELDAVKECIDEGVCLNH